MRLRKRLELGDVVLLEVVERLRGLLERGQRLLERGLRLGLVLGDLAESTSSSASFSCASFCRASAFGGETLISTSISFTSADFLSSTSICATCSFFDIASTSVAACTSFDRPPSRRWIS